MQQLRERGIYTLPEGGEFVFIEKQNHPLSDVKSLAIKKRSTFSLR